MQPFLEKIKKSKWGPMMRQVAQGLFSGARVSYSQTGEDMILDFLLNGKKRGCYVDIGAYDPKRFSNTYFFYKKGWSGITIEPNYKKHRAFLRVRPRDTHLNIGVGRVQETLDFFVFDSDTLSTFSKETAEEYKKLGHNCLEVRKVDVYPLKDIFAKYLNNRKIDSMSIDTEGSDMVALETNDWNLYRPAFIIVETALYQKESLGKKINNTYDPYFESIGYEKIADTYLNTIYRDTR